MCSGHVGPWHEAADVVGGMTIGEFGEGARQPVVRIDAGQLGKFVPGHAERVLC